MIVSQRVVVNSLTTLGSCLPESRGSETVICYPVGCLLQRLSRCSSTDRYSIAGHRTCVFFLAFNQRIHVNYFSHSPYPRPPPPHIQNLTIVTIHVKDRTSMDVTRVSLAVLL